MGIPKDLFLEPPILDLICSICTDVIEGPIQVQCAEVELDVNLFQVRFMASKFVARQIGRLKVRCANASKGCNYQGPVSENHSTTCQFQSEACPHQKHGCTEVLQRINLTQHIRTCGFELLPCPNNSKRCKPFLRKNKKHHDDTCKYFRCDYGEEGCNFVGTKSQCQAHCDGYCGKLHSQIDELETQVAELTKLLESYKVSDRLANAGQQLIQNSPRTQGWKRPRLMDSSVMDREDMLERLLQSDDYGFNVADDDQDDTRTPGYPFSEDELMGLNGLYSDQILAEDTSHSLMNEVASTPQRDGASPMSSHVPSSPPPHTKPKRKVSRYNKSARTALTQKSSQPPEDKTSGNETSVAAETPGSERRGSTPSPPSNFLSPPSSGSSRQKRPMFVLASSYLNRHSSGGNRSTASSPEMTHQTKPTWGHTPPEDPKLPSSFAAVMSDVERIATDT
ncbi:hypothetical protein INT44_001407 [Umbelopsis vinacea]|uniref:TRAF-type domain-containing protein n=1 Tax=Umbelopsis vinacea TaxID=44442 RepID=A0A8H7Q9X6_9FUNG|nr:hypothetical protein INT44_001407 [Umbelopsis vinacea]